jgi:hypothetical protein
MALGDDLLKNPLSSGDMVKGFALGVGVALLAPVAFAAMSGFARPASRAALKAGILFYEKGRETVAELGEVLDDLVAEARHELQESHREAEAGQAEADAAGQAEAEAAEPAEPK